jgi:hypothetical protein
MLSVSFVHRGERLTLTQETPLSAYYLAPKAAWSGDLSHLEHELLSNNMLSCDYFHDLEAVRTRKTLYFSKDTTQTFIDKTKQPIHYQLRVLSLRSSGVVPRYTPT